MSQFDRLTVIAGRHRRSTPATGDASVGILPVDGHRLSPSPVNTGIG